MYYRIIASIIDHRYEPFQYVQMNKRALKCRIWYKITAIKK